MWIILHTIQAAIIGLHASRVCQYVCVISFQRKQLFFQQDHIFPIQAAIIVCNCHRYLASGLATQSAIIVCNCHRNLASCLSTAGGYQRLGGSCEAQGSRFAAILLRALTGGRKMVVISCAVGVVTILGKKKGQPSLLSRPIICVCNDQ